MHPFFLIEKAWHVASAHKDTRVFKKKKQDRGQTHIEVIARQVLRTPARAVRAQRGTAVIPRHGLAHGGADAGVVRPVEELAAEEVPGVVDGAGERDRVAEAAAWRGELLGLVVPVGPRDDDLELLPRLARVGGGGGGYLGAPEGALDVCEGGGVGAVCGGVDGWVAFEVQVEGLAAGCLVAVAGALRGVVGL